MRKWAGLLVFAVPLFAHPADVQDEDVCSAVQTSRLTTLMDAARRTEAPAAQSPEDPLALLGMTKSALINSERDLAMQRRKELIAETANLRLQAENAELRAEKEDLRRALAAVTGGGGNKTNKPAPTEAPVKASARNSTRADRNSSSKKSVADGNSSWTRTGEAVSAMSGYVNQVQQKPALKASVIAVASAFILATTLGLAAWLCGCVAVRGQKDRRGDPEDDGEEEGEGVFWPLMLPFHVLDSLWTLWTRFQGLSLETKTALLVSSVFFFCGFYFMWIYGFLQPVLQYLAVYLYVFLFVVTIIVILLLELWYEARNNFELPLKGMHRLHEKVVGLEARLGWITEEEAEQLRKGSHPQYDNLHTKAIAANIHSLSGAGQ